MICGARSHIARIVQGEMSKFKEVDIEIRGRILLEGLMPSLRGKMENTPRTGDIELSANVREYVERLDESTAWELAITLFDYVETNAEKMVEMISYLNCRNQSVAFCHDYLMTDPRKVYINNVNFSSDTFYGALAKCVLYCEFAREVARIERQHPPVNWHKHSASVRRML